MHWLSTLLQRFPELAIFAAMALGFVIGSVRIGWFRLGGVAGSLLAALLIAQLDVHLDDGFQAVFFPLFAYALGYEVGPKLAHAFQRTALRELTLALFVAASTLLTVLVVSRLFGLDKGVAAGIAGGGLTQPLLVGTANETIRSLSLPSDQLSTLHLNLVLGYAVTYLVGLAGVVLVCSRFMPRLMHRDLHRDAVTAGRQLVAETGSDDDTVPVMPPLVGRAYVVTLAAGKTVFELETSVDGAATIEAIERASKHLPLDPQLSLRADDRVVLAGRRDGVVRLGRQVGPEDPDARDPEVPIAHKRVILSSPSYHGVTLATARRRLDRDSKHGVYLGGLVRAGQQLPLAPSTVLERGDVLDLYGLEKDVTRLANRTGHIVPSDDQTDFVYLGAGALAGVALGSLQVDLLGLPLSLGAGCGSLIAGAFFGWLRSRRPTFGAMPQAACSALKDIGLAGFFAAIGLNAGQHIYGSLVQHGLSLMAPGLVVTLVPLALSMLFGRYVLGYRNAALFGGALSGACASNPALSELVSRAHHRAPAVPFATTYAVASVALALLGPIIVLLV